MIYLIKLFTLTLNVQGKDAVDLKLHYLKEQNKDTFEYRC